MSFNGWIDKQNVVYTHIVEYYLSLKRVAILTNATTWMDLDTMLNEISQSEEDMLSDSTYMKCLE